MVEATALSTLLLNSQVSLVAVRGPDEIVPKRPYGQSCSGNGYYGSRDDADSV